MWERSELKAGAKRALRTNGYGIAILTSFLASILGGAFTLGTAGNSGPRVNLNFNLGGNALPELVEQGASEQAVLFMAQVGDFMMRNWPLLAAAGLFAWLAGLAYQLLVANPLEVGLSKFFVEHRTQRSQAARLFWAFREGYWRLVVTMFLRNLFVALWTMLFIIPGIVKGYQYRMVPYLLTENPALDWREALRLSRHMTEGEKGRMFVLDLSFLGWYLLVPFTLGIGILFLAPYVQQTQAELYAALRPKVADELARK